MAFFDTTWYCNFGNGTSTGHYAVAQFAASTAYSAGQLVRQLTAPAVGSERVFVVIVAGTSSTEPSWTVTRGAKNTSGTVTFQECTGASSLNGDLINTPNWTTQKATGTPTLGAIIKRNNNASYQICSTAGTLGASEPAFSDTAGTTTTEGTTTWTSLGAVGTFTGGQAPHARLASACATNWFAAGNTIYVGDNHAESQATSITINPAGSASINRMLCHNHSGAYPPAASDLTTGATITTTGNVAISLTMLGSVYFYGLVFVSGSGAITGKMVAIGTNSTSAAIANWYYFDNCSLRLGGSGSTAYIAIGDTTGAGISTIVFNNTTLKFGDVGQFMSPGHTRFTWQNTGSVLVSGSFIPSILLKAFTSSINIRCDLMLEALDLSQLTGSLYSSNLAYLLGSVAIKDCKLNSAATITTPAIPDMTVQLVRSSA